MTTGLVTVGRKQYAVGLYWENSPSGRISQAAKEAARQPGNASDFYATRAGDKKGRVPQYGLAQAGDGGFRSGQPSLAGCLANQQPGSWIGAFTFREGTAVVIVRDDLIVPEGDLFFEDEAAARDHLYQEMAVGGFQRIFAPEAWGIPGADSMPINLLLNDKADVRIHSVEMSSQEKAGIFAGVVLLIAVLGGGWYYQQQAAEAEALRLQKLAALKRMQAKAAQMALANKKAEYPPPDRKWEKHPLPMDVVRGCQDAMKKVKIATAGWRVSSFSCSPSALSVRWSRMGGVSAVPEGAHATDSVRQASQSIRYENVENRQPEKLVDPDEVSRRYLLENWPGSLRREPDDPLPPKPANHSGEWNPPPAPWIKRSFTVSVPVLPWTLPEFFSDLPGVIIKSMSIKGDGSRANDKWTIKGVIYENRR